MPQWPALPEGRVRDVIASRAFCTVQPPVVADPLLGYRLHDADLAVNKALAGAGRLEIRDYIDLIHLDGHYLGLGALVWAATGKDPGMSPLFILNELTRHTRYRPEDLAEVRLREPATLADLKHTWIEMLRTAGRLVERLPAGQLKGSWPRPVRE